MVDLICPNPECRTKLEVGDELAGKKVRWPKCKAVSVASATNEQVSPSTRSARPGQASEAEEGGVEALDAHLSRKRGQESPFEVEKEIAHGGMGAVILARDKAIQRELAVKVMRPQIADSEEHRLRFLEEAQVTGQLEHPNIVPIHELGKDAEGNLYFTMKLVKGKSLGQILTDLKTRDLRPACTAEAVSARRRPETRDRSGKAKEASRKGAKAQRAEAGSPGSAGILPASSSGEARSDGPTVPRSDSPALRDLLNIFLKVCDGIAFAHSKGVIHRDLKPDNIMVGEFGEVQIMDWGLAKVVGASCQLAASEEQGSGVSVQVSGEDQQPDASSLKPETRNLKPGQPETDSAVRKADTVRSVRTDSDVALTVDGQITGTPAYMPPEQAEGKLEMIDHRSDVYSLGAILYEIMTLERPIEGDTVHKVLLNVSDGRITPPEQRTPDRHIPKELSAVVMKAMAKNRRKRYQSVQDLGQDIRLFLEGRSVSAKEDTFAEAFGKLVKRNKGVSAAIGVAAVVLVAVVSLFTWDNMRKREIAEEARDEAIAAREEQQRDALRASRELALQAERAADDGRKDEAVARADAAARMVPDGPWGPYARGRIAAAEQDLEKAEAEFRKAVERAPDDEQCKSALAQILSLAGNVEEAAALVAGDSKDKDWHVLMKAGDALYQAERYREAERAYAQALEEFSDSKRVSDTDKDWRMLIERGDAFLAGELYPDAKAAYEKALKLAEGDGTAPPELPTETRKKLAQVQRGLSELRGTLERAKGNAWAWVQCEGFYDSIKSLPAEEQYKRIEAKLEELHGRDVASGSDITKGVLRVVSVTNEVQYLQPLKGAPLEEFFAPQSLVSDLTPLMGAPLRSVIVYGSRYIADLGPLRGMPLQELNLQGTLVSDLSPLEGMPLQKLYLNSCRRVRDLGPLTGLPLVELYCSGRGITDLSALRGMPLKGLVCQTTGVEDLSPLRGAPLEHLTCTRCPVSDLGPLEGMPLKELVCRLTGVGDLSPLRGTALRELDCGGTQVTDLSPLEGITLEKLALDSTRVRDLGPLAGMPLKWLACGDTGVTDFSPLAGMPLACLDCRDCKVRDIAALRGAPLENVNLSGTQVTDLTPLKGAPLKTLLLESAIVTDLTPLEGMNLEQLFFTPAKITKGMDVVREMKSLKRIGDAHGNGARSFQPAEFWKKYDAGEFK